MLISTFFLFILYYFFSIKRDKVILKTSGWLYFISHYQLFLFGFSFLIGICVSFVVGLIYSLFFYNSLPLFCSILLILFILPLSLDSMSYGLFGISFFKERYIKKINFNQIGLVEKLEKEVANGFSFYYLLFNYVRFLYLIISSIYFIFSYLFLCLMFIFAFWLVCTGQKIEFIHNFVSETCLGYLFLFIVFFIPLFTEAMSYAFKGKSCFIQYNDY